MKRLLLVSLLALLAAAPVAGRAAIADPLGADARALAARFFGPRLARAEIVLGSAGTPSGFRVDRGKVTSVSATALEVRELDGTTVSLPVAADVRVRLRARRGTLADVRRGARVTVVRPVDGPASEIAVGVPVRSEAGGFGRRFFGPQFARAEVVLAGRGTAVGYRVDQGQVRAVTTAALELRESDGSFASVPVAPGATVRINGRRATLARVRRGMAATTVREVGQPATEVYVVSSRQ